eukprot:TRINITY_DN1201_c1_g1_i2.p1 TRINITY_DN1201_c1_g1~~TRINITY_DN1201_c1_g1_i2.p1  ORF type:complete len:354 (+),score=73.38 TRINITY_DN1201_c1_g1_i2:324-1385(+)
MYSFFKNEGGANNWGQIQKRPNPDYNSDNDKMGLNVRVLDNKAILCSENMDGNKGGCLIVAVDNKVANRFLAYKLRPLNELDYDSRFGTSIDVSTKYIAIGAKDARVSLPSGILAGAAYVFSSDSYQQLTKVTAAGLTTSSEFGNGHNAIGINDQGLLVVGERQFTSNTGRAYVYHRDYPSANAWGQMRILEASDKATGDRFGESVALSPISLLVAAAEENSNRGAIYSMTPQCPAGSCFDALSWGCVQCTLGIVRIIPDASPVTGNTNLRLFVDGSTWNQPTQVTLGTQTLSCTAVSKLELSCTTTAASATGTHVPYFTSSGPPVGLTPYNVRVNLTDAGVGLLLSSLLTIR